MIIKKQLTILGSHVHYWVYNPGAAHTIVALHGFRGTHHGLQYIIRQLPDFKVIVPDLPGFGESTPMTERQHNVDGYRDFALAFMEATGTQHANLLGHSFGSIAAAAVAAKTGTTIKKLLLINPIAEPTHKELLSLPVEFYYWLGFKLPEPVGRLVLSNPLMIHFMSAVLAKTSDKQLRRRVHENHIAHFSSYHNRAALRQMFVAGGTHTATEYATKINVPTLIVAGANDMVAPLAGQKKLASLLPHAKLVVLSGVGHLVHYEKPAETAAAISEFILSPN